MGSRRNLPPFGQAVKIALIRKGMSSKDLAKEIGIASSTLCDLIAGRNNSEATKERVAKALDLKYSSEE